jgi:activator of 2-hydroxyglutaryl-CoA dehydratase
MDHLGCDVGALTPNVILNNGFCWDDITRMRGARASGEESLAKVLQTTGISPERSLGADGLKKYIPYPHRPENPINCLARAARWLWPTVRTVVDIGGLTTTVIQLKEQGGVLEYRNNDRCASGTGFFIELAAQALELPGTNGPHGCRGAGSTYQAGLGRAIIWRQRRGSGRDRGRLTYAVAWGRYAVRRLGIAPDIR